MTTDNNRVVKNLRHMNQQMNDITDAMQNLMEQQAHGGDADPQEFHRLLEAESVTKTAMTAQFNLNEKPMKTVLNDAK
jgi:hypothetical protein